MQEVCADAPLVVKYRNIRIAPILLLKLKPRMGICGNSLGSRRRSLCFRSSSREHVSPAEAPWRARDNELLRHFPGALKCTWLLQLVVLAPGQQRACWTCSQRPRALCRARDRRVSATECALLETRWHPVFRDPISVYYGQVSSHFQP